MSCLGRLGCVTLLAAAGVGAYATRAIWWDRVPWDRLSPRHGHAARVPDEPTWAPLSRPAADRARRRIDSLALRGGPAFVDVRGAEFASYIILDRGARLPHATDSATVAVIGSALHLKTVVDLGHVTTTKAFDKALAPLTDMLSGPQPIELAGTIDVLRPGTGEFHVTSVTVRDVPVPTPFIPRLLAGLSPAVPRAPGIAADAILVPLPPQVGDLRVGRGHVTLYRATP